MTNTAGENKPIQELVVVTGTSTGIGNANAGVLAAKGYYVLAGVRNEIDADKVRGKNIEPVILDITIDSHISALVKRINNDPVGRPLKALINNAAIEINAPVEVLPLTEWRRQFDVNVIGQVAMIQALLPQLIKSSGTIINISSIGGKGAMAGYGPYAATKFALEGLSDSLRRELMEHNVKVVLVEPGAVTSPMSLNVRAKAEKITREMSPVHRSRYGNLMYAMVAQAESYISNAVSAEKAGQVVAGILSKKKPAVRYTIGNDAKMVSLLLKIMPDRMLDNLLYRTFKQHYPKTA